MQITRRGPSRRIDPAKAALQIIGAPRSVGHAKARRSPEEARQEIIEVARSYISKNGLRDLTVDKLMQSTEIGRSAFYTYFGSIHALAAVFVHELSAKVEASSAAWYADNADPIRWLRKTLRGGVEFYEANGPMIRALEVASWQDDKLRAAFRDKIGLRPIVQTTAIILRDQAKGWIGPMDAQEISIALNRFTLTYLNDRFGNPGRKSKPTDKQKALEVLERVWAATLYGKIANPRRKRVRKQI